MIPLDGEHKPLAPALAGEFVFSGCEAGALTLSYVVFTQHLCS